MKKFVLSISCLLMAGLLVAQSPEAFKYQAIARDATGVVLADKSVGFRISIIEGSETGTIVFAEVHIVTTNAFGLVNLDIGGGLNLSGSIAAINWGINPHYLRVEMDPNGGTSFTLMGTSQLLSVPYALHAKTVQNDQVNDADADPANEIQTLQLVGNQLTLSLGGGTVSLPTGADNWGTQVVLTDASLTGNGTSGSTLKIADGGVTGAKIAQAGATPGQALKWNGTTWAPANDEAGSSQWTQSGANIHFSTGKVGVGKDPGADLRQFQSLTEDYQAIAGVNNSSIYATIFAQNLGTGPAADFRSSIRIMDGTQGAGKVLTSDVGGLASWTTLSPSGLTLPYEQSATSPNPVFHVTNDGVGHGIQGTSSAAGSGYGIYGNSLSATGRGVYGFSESATGQTYGVFGQSASPDGRGVAGWATSSTGLNYGVRGFTASNEGIGVEGQATSTTGVNIGVRGETSSPDGFSGFFTGGTFFSDLPVGLGTKTPTRSLTIFAGTGNPAMSFINNATGNNTTDGLYVGMSGMNGYLWHYEDAPLYLGTNNVARLAITNEGDIGIGTVVPGAKLQITLNSTISNPQLLLSESDDEFARLMFRNSVSTTYNWTIAGSPAATDAASRLNIYHDGAGAGRNVASFTGDGKLGVMTESPTQTLDVNGNARFRSIGSGAYSGPVNRMADGTLTTATSDGRLKENVKTLDNSLMRVMNLRGVSFTWKDKPEYGTKIGFIAQEFGKVVPELVFTNETDGYMGINYSEVTALLVEAIKELKAENDRLTAENETIRSQALRIAAEHALLNARLEKIESYLKAEAKK